METEKKIMGRCPLCGGNVVKTCKGYRCEHNIGEQPSCVLNINAIIGNRKMEDDEITELLDKRFILLDGFATKEERLSRPYWNWLMTEPSICRLSLPSVPIVAVTSVWEAGRSTAPTMATRKLLATSPSGGTSAVIR